MCWYNCFFLKFWVQRGLPIGVVGGHWAESKDLECKAWETLLSVVEGSKQSSEVAQNQDSPNGKEAAYHYTTYWK